MVNDAAALTCGSRRARLELLHRRKGTGLSSDEKQTSEEMPAEERDELEDLDVSEQKAEDVRGGARARREP